MNEMKELTAKEEAFCVAYTTIGSETFSNGTQAAIVAEYAEDSARTQAWRMLRKEHIRNRIRELFDKNMEENMVTISSVLANLRHDRQMARQHNQYHVAKSCTELEGRYLAMFTDNVQDVTEKPVKLTEEEKAEYRKIAREMLKSESEARSLKARSESEAREPERDETPEPVETPEPAEIPEPEKVGVVDYD